MKQKQVYRSDRQVERQTNILHMARTLAGRVGYDGLTMRELADLAGVSPKTLYNLFNSKDELLVAALQDLVGIIRRSVRDHTHLDGFDYILAVRRSGSAAIARSPGFANVIVSLVFRAKPNDQLVQSLVGGSRGEMVQHIEHEQARGHVLPNVDPTILSWHLFAQSWSTLLAWDKGLLGHDEIVAAEQFGYLTTLLGVSTPRRRRKLQDQLLELNYSPTQTTVRPEQPRRTAVPPGDDTQRRRYRSERQLERRANILQAVRSAITEAGYQGMTMRGLADVAGVSPKTLYNIYGSKDELLLAAVLDLLTGIDRSIPHDSDSSVLERMLVRQEPISKEIKRNPRYARAITEALLQAKPGDRLVEVLLKIPVRTLDSQLRTEIPESWSSTAIAQLLATQPWAILMLWCKGVMGLEHAIQERRRSLLITLAAITTGKKRSAWASILQDMEWKSLPKATQANGSRRIV
jgi:AcrR family transcriptional regulator